MKPPYFSQPSRSFWASSLQGRGLAEIDFNDFYRKKFDLAGAPTASAGACFAQCMVPLLKKNGFNYLEVETTGARRSSEESAALHYDEFSARYGQVQTSRQLLQLLQRALGLLKPEDKAWPRGTGVVDPFRPNISPKPYSTEAEMTADRQRHLEKVLELFEKTEVFFFTLTQTEAWESRLDGAVFPIVPGLLTGGVWDPAKYRFRNLRYADVMEDMGSFLALSRQLNPRISLVLTVSPVYLVSTAGDEHILAADAYSKSVLRAAAGDLYRDREEVDYYPAWEMTAGLAGGGRFYDPTGRNLSAEGVAWAMEVFFKTHSPAGAERAADLKMPADEELFLASLGKSE